jgi:hypothetical protein
MMNQNEGHHNKLKKLYETKKVALHVLLGLIYSAFNRLNKKTAHIYDDMCASFCR